MMSLTTISNTVANGLRSAIPALRRPRQFERFPVCIPAILSIEGQNYEDDGLVLEVSAGGLLFRQASQYIVHIAGRGAKIRFLEHKLEGTIVNTQSRGYGIRLASRLIPEEVDRLFEEYGIVSAAE